MQTLLPRRLAEDETPFSSPDEPHVSIRTEVWRLAWPSVATFMLMTTNSILDRMFVGTLGRDALAAVGVGGQLIFLLVSLSMAITVGTTALVARFTGAEDPRQAARATGQSITLGLLIGIFCTLAVSAALGPFLQAVGLSDGAQAQCRRFLETALWGMVPMFLANVLSAAFRGLGDTRTPLKVMICANLVHVTGDFILIFGRFGMPRLGLAGAGVALSSANAMSFLAFAVFLGRSPLRSAWLARELRLTQEWTARILKIGIPAAITALLRTTSLMSFTGVLARTAESMSAVAALPIGMTAESIAFMPGFGFSVAASALVGQSLGARKPDRAERAGWEATWQGVLIMTVMGLVFFAAAPRFAALFTHDPKVLALAVSYLRIMAVSEPMLAFGMVLTGALQGAGDTVRPAVLTAVTFWVFRLPVAWLLALKLGYNTAGAWVAMSASTVLSGVLAILLFREGSWKRIKV